MNLTDGDAVPILMYHEVARLPRRDFIRFTVAEREFAWQVRWLARLGFTAISMDQLVAARDGSGKLPRRPVVITFDDGFADSARFAPPILRRFGFTATFYLVAGLVGRPSEWLQREVGFTLPLMNWEAVHALQNDGFHFGSHTLTHPRLARIPAENGLDELARSRAILEQALGRRVEHLAYPFGSHDERVIGIAKEAGYRTACTTIEARSQHEDLLALRRIPVYGTDSKLDFVARVLTAKPAASLVRAARRWLRHSIGAS